MLRLLRPSYGAYDPEVLRIAAALGYHTVLWDTDSGDGRSGATTRSIIANASRGGDGAVVLLHCGPKATVDAVGRIIDRYRARGYRLVDLGQLLELEPPLTACRVTNERSGASATSLQRAARRADAGDRLTLQGTCLGTSHMRKDLEVSGMSAEDSGAPTLDGLGRGTVVTVKAGVTVTLRELTVRTGERGIENFGDLTLDGVIVEGNRGQDVGAGVLNAEGATLRLTGSSVIRRNAATVAGGGVLNIGMLELRDASTIVRNVVLGESGDAAAGASPPDQNDVPDPVSGASPAAGAGGGIMDLGVLVGAVCAPETFANIRGNSPDDCYSLDSSIPAPWALDSLRTGIESESPGLDGAVTGPDACPPSAGACPTAPADTPPAT